jgi:glutamate 5-kinase
MSQFDFNSSKRLVIKIGSSLLIDSTDGQLRRDWLDALADDLKDLHQKGSDVLVVSSGAIGLGRSRLKIATGELKLEDSQAAAAAGQIQLAHAWEAALARHDIPVAQILLTSEDTEQRRRYLNARSTIENLLTRRAIPVINENDTVATDEIRFGDNDRLAASDVDGLYTGDPHGDKDAELLEEIVDITASIEAMAGITKSDYGRGGMITKIKAARIAVQAGCNMVITSGRYNHPLRELAGNGRRTVFLANANPATARKRWIAGSLKPSGTLIVDNGAAKALQSGKSLLPAGIVKINGNFERGDAVLVEDATGRELARGLSAYSAIDAIKIKGCRSHEIADVLGFKGRAEMIHRDDLVLLTREA